MKTSFTILLVAILAILYSCDVENPTPDPIENPEYANWTIPKIEIIQRGLENDLIPSIDNPEFMPVNSATHLEEDDVVLGINVKGDYRAYPVKILNYHEVINDHFAAGEKTIAYCPLSGSYSMWDNTIKGIATTFGVSRYIYNSTHILYDRVSKGHWLPTIYACVNGELEGLEIEGQQMIALTWGKWKSMFPGSKVLESPVNTAFDYQVDLYEEYKTSDTLTYPVYPLNLVLPPKKKVHGVIVGRRMKVYSPDSFGDSTTVIQDNFQGLSIVVVGNTSDKFIVSYERRFSGGPELDFLPAQDVPANIIMTDSKGNKYDIFGLVVDGPDKGQALTPTKSITGYWFVMATIFSDPVVY